MKTTNIEKMERIIEIIKAINKDSILAKKLALKGGTAINLLYSTVPRLSLDADFNYIINCKKDDMLDDRINVRNDIESWSL